MSLSNTEDKYYTGRVIMGIDSENNAQEMTIQEMEGKKRPTWDDDASNEYFDRVKTKAQALAKDIIAKAMEEAENIKVAAHSEGYAQGQNEAKAQAEEQFQTASHNFGSILTQINDQSANAMYAQSADAASLVLMVIEKVLSVEVESRRKEILESLILEALGKIDSQTNLIIKISPDDASIIEELMQRATQEFPTLSKWRIKTDPTLDNGGVIVEADDILVDNNLTSRFESVQEILSQLTPDMGELDG